MADQVVSSLLSSTLAETEPAVDKEEVVQQRRTADYHPSVWGDYFLNCSEDTEELNAWSKRVEELKIEVKNLMSRVEGSVQQIELINELQRLGVAYHFEKEIEEALHRIYLSYSATDYDDLSTVAVRFRLLRQEGYNVSPDLFIKFEDDNGHFQKSLSSDVRGMLSLYEAAYFGTHGEDILDEAIAFTSQHLRASMPHLDLHLSRQVERALELPLRKRIQRIEVRQYISVYEDEASRNSLLLELAKLDFNILQSFHRKELKQISMWWKDIYEDKKQLHYARDRLVELFLWVLAIYSEPKYSRARQILIRIMGLFSLLDDTYDSYGTLEELEPFTDAIQRWEVGTKNQLPNYMQVLFQAILNTMEEIAGLLTPEERSYRIPNLKTAIKELSKGYLVEQQLVSRGYFPPLDEYLNTAILTCGHFSLTISSFVGMDEVATKEAFEWAMKFPKIIYASSVVCRMLDDIVSREFEQKRGQLTSGIDCYMKEFGASEEEARKKFREMVTAAWKDMNGECIKPSALPMALLIRPIHFACVIEVLYMYGDEYTHSSGETKAKIVAVLVEPIPISA